MTREFQIARDVGLLAFGILLAAGVAFSAYKVYALANMRVAVTQIVHYAAKVEEDANETRVTCVICLDDYTDGEVVQVLECKHAFHKRCFKQMKDHRSTPTMPPGALQTEPPLACPVCRGCIRSV